MTFTDAHSGSSVCTPTRYGLLTGRYSWRTRLQAGVVQGFAPCLIAQDRLTVAGLLKKKGYATAIIGKWHLDFQYQDPKTEKTLPKENTSVPNWINDSGRSGSSGFDYFHGNHHAGSMDTIIENDRVIERLDEIHNLPGSPKNQWNIFSSGQRLPINLSSFMCHLGSPHTPIVPTKEWQGKSGLGDYGDFVMQTDATVGQSLRLCRNMDFEITPLLFSPVIMAVPKQQVFHNFVKRVIMSVPITVVPRPIPGMAVTGYLLSFAGPARLKRARV